MIGCILEGGCSGFVVHKLAIEAVIVFEFLFQVSADVGITVVLVFGFCI